MNYDWIFKPLPPQEVVRKLSAELNISEVLAQLLAQRGITTFEEARHFFRPSIDDLHDPFLMKDMQKAVRRLNKALEEGEAILIYGDYDVDGTSSVALMYRYLSQFTSELFTYVPDRYTEGYGVSFKGIDYAVEQHCSLIITLDCGVKAIDKVLYAKEKGIDCIICDHHRPSEQVPEAVAILNPKQEDCPYPYKELCGCGIGFKFAQAHNAFLGKPFEEIKPLLELVAVATAADIVPVNGENRVLMYYGLEIINTHPSAGIRVLFPLDKAVHTSDIVFQAAPRINAAGRIEHGRLAIVLLTENNYDEALAKVKKIEALNQERKALDHSIAEEALEQIRQRGEENHYTTVVYNEAWHKGVIGIVASRLMETYYRPTLVFTKSGDKYAASARSVRGFDIYEALEQCSAYIEQFGGHTYAAGLTLLPEQYEPFKAAFEQIVAQSLPTELRAPQLKIDATLPIEEITAKKYAILKQFEPFGPENMTPVFYAGNVVDTGYARAIGNKEEHLKLTVKDRGGKQYLPAVGFSLGHKLPLVKSGRPFQIVYSIEENHFNGQTSLQLHIRDIR